MVVPAGTTAGAGALIVGGGVKGMKGEKEGKLGTPKRVMTGETKLVEKVKGMKVVIGVEGAKAVIKAAVGGIGGVNVVIKAAVAGVGGVNVVIKAAVAGVGKARGISAAAVENVGTPKVGGVGGITGINAGVAVAGKAPRETDVGITGVNTVVGITNAGVAEVNGV